jgi:hypothetical protein
MIESEVQPIGCPFNAIYIIDGKSGLTLLAQNYSDRPYDDDLMSGMVKALECFISYLANANGVEKVQEINFQGCRILYERKGPIMAVAISKKTDQSLEHQVLGAILDEFYGRFERFLEGFVGNIAPFKEFLPRLEQLGREFPKNIHDLERVQKEMIASASLIQKELNAEFNDPQKLSGPKFPTFHGFQQFD